MTKMRTTLKQTRGQTCAAESQRHSLNSVKSGSTSKTSGSSTVFPVRTNKFNENFMQPPHLLTAKAEGKIYSGRVNGKNVFVSAEDIAVVAFDALINLNQRKPITWSWGPRC